MPALVGTDIRRNAKLQDKVQETPRGEMALLELLSSEGHTCSLVSRCFDSQRPLILIS